MPSPWSARGAPSSYAGAAGASWSLDPRGRLGLRLDLGLVGNARAGRARDAVGRRADGPALRRLAAARRVLLDRPVGLPRRHRFLPASQRPLRWRVSGCQGALPSCRPLRNSPRSGLAWSLARRAIADPVGVKSVCGPSSYSRASRGLLRRDPQRSQRGALRLSYSPPDDSGSSGSSASLRTATVVVTSVRPSSRSRTVRRRV